MSIRRRWWLGAAALLLTTGLLALLVFDRPSGGLWPGVSSVSSGSSAVSSANEAASSAINPWGLAAQVGAEADQAAASAAAEKAWLLDPKHDAAWCEQGPPRVAEALRTHGEGGRQGSPRGPATEALAQSAEELLQSWAAQLSARGDAASLATRDFLLANLDTANLLQGGPVASSEQRLASAKRLLQSGLAASEGYGSRLATQQACRKSESSLCVKILQRWLQLEPWNLDAQLWSLSLLPESAPEGQWLPLLNQALASNQEEPHRQRYYQTLLQLMSEDAPAGLRSAAALQLATAAIYTLDETRYFVLVERCREASSTAAKAACTGVAERLYSQSFGPVLARMVAVSIARNQETAAGLWQERHEEVQALQYWSREHRDLNDEQVESLNLGSCALQPALRQRLRSVAQLDDLAAMRESLAAQGLNPKIYLGTVRSGK
ncbi:hypothetical protein [Roseateles microcysteis]|uniref:hypothetical protein n=1 Tax=Roseateles microcysteis TaxID=3119057 RepID=UPI002FE582EE